MLDSITATVGPPRFPDADATITQMSPPTEATPARSKKTGDASASPMYLVEANDEVADRAGIHVTQLSGIERGRRNSSLNNLYAVAQALDVPAGELFGFKSCQPENGGW